MDAFEKFKEINKEHLKNGIYFLNELSRINTFASLYHRLREEEGRIYGDETLRRLPEISKRHKLYKEWKIRENSANKLLSYLSKIGEDINVLDLGCGNGWLTHKISQLSKAKVIGIDVNKQELEQAARVFGNNDKLIWVYTDFFTSKFSGPKFDIIILGGVVMYFKDVKSLINHLLDILNPNGEIHIFDSPFYTAENVESARERSQNYYTSIGFPEMINHFHHHTFNLLENFNVNIINKPNTTLNRITRHFINRYISPFYWLKIKK